MTKSRIGNSVFFIGLILLVLAVVVWEATDEYANGLVFAIGSIALACMGLGAWLWNRPSPGGSQSTLSRSSPKHKLLAGVAGLGLWLALLLGGSNDIKAKFVAMALVAYGLVGGLEILIDKRYPTLKPGWDAMGAWKKILISTAVIIASFAVFINLMRLVGLLLMSG
jgi:hypothetical protein